MATPPPRLLQCSVKLLFLSEEQLLEGLHLSSPSQKAFQLEVLPREEVADMTVTDGKSTEAEPEGGGEVSDWGHLGLRDDASGWGGGLERRFVAKSYWLIACVSHEKSFHFCCLLFFG